jgi:hypothetical protein
MRTPEAKRKWLLPQVKKWVHGVHQLAKVARRFPQTAFAGLAKSLQSEWLYVQRVAPDLGHEFAPVEKAMRDVFLPALLGDPLPATDRIRDQASLSTKFAGLGLPNPTETAEANYMASQMSTSVLAKSLINGDTLDVVAHHKKVAHARKSAKDRKTTALEASHKALCDEGSKGDVRRLTRSKGAWLNITPNTLNATALSRDEFRDSLRIRMGKNPLLLPEECDGCGDTFTVNHALTCAKGGLVLLRHNAMAQEWHDLCASATTPTAVSDEPLIYTGPAALRESGADQNKDLRGDVAVQGFWKRQTTAIFDIRVTDTDAKSYQGQSAQKSIARQEKEKKDKYVDACVERRRQFTPLVYSVDGLLGSEARAASKRLACLLSQKWKCAYSDVCGYVLSRQALALVRTTSLCLRGTRNPSDCARYRSAAFECGSGLSTYC